MKCPTCGKVLDMRDLATVFGHGVPDPERPGQFKCLSDEEISAANLPPVTSRKVGRPVQWASGKNPIYLN